MPVNTTCFAVDKSALQQTSFRDAGLAAIEPGQILVKVDRFAFTANNITYAELGDRLAYWRFFPAPEDKLGIIPVWGFGDVIESRHETIRAGERIYGFLPMATHVVFQPDRVNPASFVEASAHRAELPPAYNLYMRCADDPLYEERHEDLQALLRPLFITSFLIDDFLADENFFGAKAVVLSSASSKTAFGLAHLLHKRGNVEVIGLTSAPNIDFVESLGCYHRVVAYDAIGTLTRQPAVYVDFAGSATARTTVHQHYGEQLKYSCAVGLSHREMNPPGKSLPGIKPIFFFAPDRLRKRAKDWGREGIDERVAIAWRDFVHMASAWLTVSRGNRTAIESVYAETLAGKVKPKDGHILSLWN